MPSETSAVGSLTLPVPATASGAKFVDPVIEALLAFGGFYLKNALDIRLASVRSLNVVDACPTANRFSFDPLEPRGHQVHMYLPALYIWWDGNSKVVEWTTYHDYRVRTLGMMYVYEELPGIESMVERRGWSNAVDAAFHKLNKRQAHTSYTPAGGAPGMDISQSMADLGVIDWKYLGGKPGRFGIDEGPLAERRAAKKSGRDWPAVAGNFEVWEKVLPMTLEDPADVLGDSPMTINGPEGVPIMERFLDAPDGSEDL